MRVLITGGAGFVGANVALGLATRHPDWDIVAFDNLYRRGSELNVPRLTTAGVEFVRGDVRDPGDLEAAGPCDSLIECSAEPSVLAGVHDSPSYVIDTNLGGAHVCLEHCRRHGAAIVFLSTSRVYPVAHLRSLQLEEHETRFALADVQPLAGASATGISEAFPLDGARTFYGATKLAAELLVAEYRETYGVRAVIDRFGVIAGPWQMGKVDQGIVAHWVLAHHFRRPLAYLGFGGGGKQVRDVLHVDDVVDLIDLQVADTAHWDGAVVNAGGGTEISVSLRELTALCAEATGRETAVVEGGPDRPGDIPVYVSDCARLYGMTDWRPQRDARTIVADTAAWVAGHESELAALA